MIDEAGCIFLDVAVKVISLVEFEHIHRAVGEAALVFFNQRDAALFRFLFGDFFTDVLDYLFPLRDIGSGEHAGAVDLGLLNVDVFARRWLPAHAARSV